MKRALILRQSFLMLVLLNLFRIATFAQLRRTLAWPIDR
jgi:hypothetical protein